MEATVFNRAQLEVINSLSVLQSDEDIDELKSAIVNVLNSRLQKEICRLESEGVLTPEKYKEFETAHYRTPYKH